MSDTITRFAPSPTGHLHIGGARTALFNWAYAKNSGGKFLLRMEDTDQARSTEAATHSIIADMKWLGMLWDIGPDHGSQTPYQDQLGETGPYFQSQRLETYAPYFDQLLEKGLAYKCFKTAEQLAAERAAAREAKIAYKYDRTEMANLTSEQVAAYEAEGKSSVLRFKAPAQEIVFQDQILGEIHIAAEQLEDFVIRKSDGFPTYHFAVVVDDALMKVTHVLRAQEHLNNTWKHWCLQDALGLDHPTYAHMPLIFNTDGSKMSKRDKAKTARKEAKEAINKKTISLEELSTRSGIKEAELSTFLNKKNDEISIALAVAEALNIILPEIDVEDFKRSGYLPEVVLNYIALLGWSPGNDIEHFDMNFLCEKFDLTRIGKSNAKFDRVKLSSFNTTAISQLSEEAFATKLRAHCEDYHPEFLEKMNAEHFQLFANSYRERSRTLEEPCTNGKFFICADDAITYNPKAVKKVLKKNEGAGLKVLSELEGILTALENWTKVDIETALKSYAETNELGLGSVAQPLRVALTGNTTSPPIYDTLEIQGRESTLNRIQRCLKHDHA